MCRVKMCSSTMVRAGNCLPAEVFSVDRYRVGLRDFQDEVFSVDLDFRVLRVPDSFRLPVVADGEYRVSGLA